MSMMLRNMFRLHRLMDEAAEAPDLGGGGEITMDIDKASDQLGAELGLGEETQVDDLDTATPSGEKKPAAASTQETPEVKAAREARERAAAAQTPAAKAAAAVAATKALTDAKAALTTKKVDFTGKTDAEILELAKPAAAPAKVMPQSWKKELTETWAKLPPEAQAYIEQREAQVAEGFKANANAVRYADAIFKTLAPHEALLKSQGVNNHVEFVNSLVNAHYVLSAQPDTARYPYMAQILKTYGLDPAKVGEAFTALGAAPAAPARTAETVALEQRMQKLEQDRKDEASTRFASLKEQSAREVEAFASDPAHPFFDLVASEVSLFLADPKITLPQAYEMAVYANPVTRAKELARLQGVADDKARVEAEAKAAAAIRAKGTRVRGEERHRGSPDLLGSMDDTMKETLASIKSRVD